MFGLLMTVSTNSIPSLRTYDVVKYLAIGSECFSKAELALMNVPNEARQGVSQLNLPSHPSLSNPATSSRSCEILPLSRAIPELPMNHV